jgi:hypothetical protein
MEFFAGKNFREKEKAEKLKKAHKKSVEKTICKTL